MDIAGQDRKIGVFVNDYGFESPLIQVAGSVVSAVEVACIGYIEVAHELRKIGQGNFDQQMKMVAHHDMAIKLYGVDIDRLAQQLKKSAPVSVIPKDILPFVAATGDVVYSVGMQNIPLLTLLGTVYLVTKIWHGGRNRYRTCDPSLVRKEIFKNK